MKKIQSIYKTVSWKIDDPEPAPEVQAMFRRMGEVSKLKAMLPELDTNEDRQARRHEGRRKTLRARG